MVCNTLISKNYDEDFLYCIFNLANYQFHLIGIETLVSTLKDMTYLPDRKEDGALVFSVDHCFSIKGQGTVLTGTILQGNVKINDVSLVPLGVPCSVKKSGN